MLLYGQGSQILLAGLERGRFLIGRALKVHGEPKRPDHKSTNSGSDILGHFPTVVLASCWTLPLLAWISA
jgi:hypothetical protein